MCDGRLGANCRLFLYTRPVELHFRVHGLGTGSLILLDGDDAFNTFFSVTGAGNLDHDCMLFDLEGDILRWAMG